MEDYYYSKLVIKINEINKKQKTIYDATFKIWNLLALCFLMLLAVLIFK